MAAGVEDKHVQPLQEQPRKLRIRQIVQHEGVATRDLIELIDHALTFTQQIARLIIIRAQRQTARAADRYQRE